MHAVSRHSPWTRPYSARRVGETALWPCRPVARCTLHSARGPGTGTGTYRHMYF